MSGKGYCLPSEIAASVAAFRVENLLALTNSFMGSRSPSWNALRAVLAFKSMIGLLLLSAVFVGMQAVFKSDKSRSTRFAKSV